MTRLTDGKRTVEITITEWNGSGYTPDWSSEFFSVGSLPYDEESDAYVVEDVDYCIEQANDWQNGVGDFLEDEEIDVSDRCVTVDDVA